MDDLPAPILCVPTIAINSAPISIHPTTIYAGRLNGKAGTGYTVLKIANAMKPRATAGIMMWLDILNIFSL